MNIEKMQDNPTTKENMESLINGIEVNYRKKKTNKTV